MTAEHESRADRRRRITEQIHRQRMELGHAFTDLARPLQYTQTAIVGLQALKQNAWLIALVPTVAKLGFTFFGWKKDERAKGIQGILGLFRKGDVKEARREAARTAEREAARAKKPLARVLKHGWSLFKLYRKVRPFFP